MHVLKKVLLIAAGFGVAVATVSAAPLTAEEQIKFRKAGYSFMAWNMGKIKAQVVDGEVAFNKDQVAAAARAIAGVANSGMGALYGPGTEKDAGSQKTRVKPEFFKNMDQVKKHAQKFNSEANKLAEVAAAGDQAAIKAQFGELGKACKACHDDFRVKD